MKRKILLPFLLILLLASSGCYLLETKPILPRAKKLQILKHYSPKSIPELNRGAPHYNAFVPGVGTLSLVALASSKPCRWTHYINCGSQEAWRGIGGSNQRRAIG